MSRTPLIYAEESELDGIYETVPPQSDFESSLLQLPHSIYHVIHLFLPAEPPLLHSKGERRWRLAHIDARLQRWDWAIECSKGHLGPCVDSNTTHSSGRGHCCLCSGGNVSTYQDLVFKK